MADTELYQQLDDALAAVDSDTSAAEAHGVLCGMLSGPEEPDRARWIAQVLEYAHARGDAARACLELLTQLFTDTTEEMADEELRFRPLLPSEEAPIGERSAALGRWCEGYLLGLPMGGLAGSEHRPREVDEVLRDFGEIARIEDDPDPDEDNEAAYAELVEYVRMGALLVQEHATASQRQPAGNPPRGNGSDGG
ncbi:MAG: YecA family protein [Arhodomonas sp.]|nr:YecA family protein [Arhodomonas sp.]